MWGFQAEGAAPIVRGERVAAPETVATAIRIGDPASWAGAVAARDESGGLIARGQRPGDPGRAAAAVGARRASSSSRPARPRWPGCCSATQRGLLDPGQLVVCTVTGNGLKDTETALREITIDTDTVPADVRAAAAVLGLQPA